jgi:phosphinothricin acetyltransferase
VDTKHEERQHVAYSIRVATPDDAASIVAIYAPYVQHTTVTCECVVPTVDAYRSRIASITDRYPFLVACDHDESVIGYAYAGPFKPRSAYDWSVETTVYVSSDCQGRGVARGLYDALERVLVEQHITNENACIIASNAQSIAFHEHRGFHQVALFSKCAYKLGEWLDMVWMEKTIAPHVEQPQPILDFPLWYAAFQQRKSAHDASDAADAHSASMTCTSADAHSISAN